MSVTAGARESGKGETQGGGAEEEVCGEGETDPQSAREPERTANTAAAAGERLISIQYLTFLEVWHGVWFGLVQYCKQCLH